MKQFIALLLVALLPVYFAYDYIAHGKDSIDAEVKTKQPAIETALNRWLEHRLCVRAGPFPYDNRRARQGCDKCGPLAELGLLDKTVTEGRPGQPGITFTLTSDGEAIYNDDLKLDTKLCFGKAKVHKVLAANSPQYQFGTRSAQVKFQVEVEDPHPILRDGRAATLALEVPMAGTPALFPPECVTVDFLPDGSVDLNDMQVVRWPCAEIWGGKS